MQSRALGMIRSHVVSVLKGASSQVTLVAILVILVRETNMDRKKKIGYLFKCIIHRYKLQFEAVVQAKQLFQRVWRHLLYMFASRQLLVRYIFSLPYRLL